MLRRLYDWTMSLAARRSAEVWLAVIAFVESSVFLVPADVLFLPMALAKPERSYRYAIVATAASVLGGIAGWALGFYAYETVARPVLEFYGKLDAFEQMKSYVTYETILLLLVTSGLAHLPPIKIVTILSGVDSRQHTACSSFRRSSPAARDSYSWPGCFAATASRSAISSKSAWGILSASVQWSPSCFILSIATLPTEPSSRSSAMTAIASPLSRPVVSIRCSWPSAWRRSSELRSASEYIGGYIPCALCLLQREPYYYGIPIGDPRRARIVFSVCRTGSPVPCFWRHRHADGGRCRHGCLSRGRRMAFLGRVRRPASTSAGAIDAECRRPA